MGEEAPFIYWLKNGEFVMQENARFINGYLDISDLGKKDTGIYQCFASNDAGNIQAAALLQISGTCFLHCFTSYLWNILYI